MVFNTTSNTTNTTKAPVVFVVSLLLPFSTVIIRLVTFNGADVTRAKPTFLLQEVNYVKASEHQESAATAGRLRRAGRYSAKPTGNPAAWGLERQASRCLLWGLLSDLYESG